jgi:hypothetical protein
MNGDIVALEQETTYHRRREQRKAFEGIDVGTLRENICSRSLAALSLQRVEVSTRAR